MVNVLMNCNPFLPGNVSAGDVLGTFTQLTGGEMGTLWVVAEAAVLLLSLPPGCKGGTDGTIVALMGTFFLWLLLGGAGWWRQQWDTIHSQNSIQELEQF